MNKRASLLSLGAVGMIVFQIACNSSSTDSSGAPDLDAGFVADESNSGSFSIRIISSTVATGDTTKFTASIRDASGAAVPNIRVSCDTEKGLALIEPATGVSISDDYGNISGVLGCEAPGSFRMACRLPLGFGAREFAGVFCDGELPAGFTGFGEAGGGGLGGGVDTSEDEGSTTQGIRITSIEFLDDGTSTSTTSIDIFQSGDCDGDVTTADPEPFFDTRIQFKIQNNSNEIVRFSSYRYTVSNFNGSGASYTSPKINLTGESLSVDSDGGEASVTALFADAVSGGKRFFGRSDTITSTGFRNIKVEVTGETSSGKAVSITAGTAASFDGFNRCTTS